MGCNGSKQKEQKKAATDGEKTLLQQNTADVKVDGKKRALIVSTSSALMGEHKTGAWSEEICGPFYAFQDAGIDVTVCSIAGGDIPVDEGSLADQFKTENDKKMIESGSGPLKGTAALESIDTAPYDIVFFAGGHGTCVDFPTAAVGTKLSEAFANGKVVATVCHGAMALVTAKGADGEPLVKGKRVACFTDEEETQVGLHEKVPFLLEAKLKELGGLVESTAPWSDQSVQDGKLVTGQNPQSSVSCAKLAIALVVPTSTEQAAAQVEKVEEASPAAADKEELPTQKAEKTEDVPEPVSEQKEASPAKESAPDQYKEAAPDVIETETKTTLCC